jgi:type VI protein secretion system component VasF
MSFKYWPEISFYLKQIEHAQAEFRKKSVTVQGIESLREAIVHQINQLKYSLLTTLEEHPISLMLFAIAAVLDEEIQAIISETETMRWPPLSKDFYGDYTAGELFYRSIDEILDNQKMDPIVFEVFFYAIKRGFKGQYRDSKIQISKYLDLLQERIPKSEQVKPQVIQTIKRPLGRVKPKQYYQIALASLGILYAGLYWVSR